MTGSILVAILVLLISSLGTNWLIGFLTKRGVMDNPNQRSTHKHSIPRGGGIAIVVSILAGACLWYFLGAASLPGTYYWLGLVVIAAVSFLDDRLRLPVYVRIAVQLILAYLVAMETGGLEKFPLPDPISFDLKSFNVPLSILWIVGVINIYNFLDGIDGYAGMQAVLAGVGLMVFDYQGPGFYMGMLLFCACIGFLRYNWYPAKIFMGDVGSTSIGFILATTPFYFSQGTAYQGVFVMIILLWYFLSDGALTILKRVLRGEKVWKAHRSHLYQILVDGGMAQQAVVSYVMIRALALLLLLYLTITFYPQYQWVVLIMGLILLVLFQWKANRIAHKPVS